MIELTPVTVAIIMLGGLLIGVFSGFPVGYIVGFLGIAVGAIVWREQVGQIIYIRAFSLMISYPLLAVPLFVFMGTVLESSGIVERLFDVLYLWLGGFRGGLLVVTILVGTIMAATVGIISASVTMLTLVALPAMVKRGYNRSLAAGATCASGVLGILIPPSIMIILYADMAGVPPVRLLFACFIPGFLLSGLYIMYVIIRSLLEPHIGPPVPIEERAVPFRTKTIRLFTALVPPAILVMSVLGVIFFGIAPPTEAAGIGAFAAILLAIAYRRFSWAILREVMILTIKLCGFIFLVGTMSFAFVGVFLGAGAGKLLTEMVLAMPGGKWGAFAMIQFIIFMLGFFIDWIGIVFIMVPIITPIVKAVGFDPIWFSALVMVNLQTAFMTPPFAMAIYICKGAADPALNMTVAEIIRGVVPFVILILVGMLLLVAYPELVTWLPDRVLVR